MKPLLTIARSWRCGVSLRLKMKFVQSFAVPILLAVLGVSATPAIAAEEEGVAVAILYDTSGSMKSPVKDATGRYSPKYIIANRALEAIAGRLESFATNRAAGPRKVHAGLFVFRSDQPHPALPLGPFNASAFTKWA